MRNLTVSTAKWVSIVSLLFAVGAQAQGSASGAQVLTSVAAEPETSTAAAPASTAQALIPRLIKFGGLVHDLAGKPLSGPVDVTFALYRDGAGGSPLWFETQTVQADSLGKYTALLGAMSAQGLPTELFASGEAHWLGIQVSNLPEQPRVLLVSVPYALKAADAEMLGGKPASAFQLAPESSTDSESTTTDTTADSQNGTSTGKNSTTKKTSDTAFKSITAGATANFLAAFLNDGGTLGTSTIYQAPTTDFLGIGTNTPTEKLQVNGNILLNSYNLGAGSGLFFRYGFSPNGPNNTNTYQRNVSIRVRGLGSPGTPDGLEINGFDGIIFGTGGDNDRMVVDTSGKVGIGTTVPTEKIEVRGNMLLDAYNTGAGSGIFFRRNYSPNGVNNASVYQRNVSIRMRGLGTPASPDGLEINGFDGIVFGTGGANDRMVVAPNGNVGIGTLAPSQKLDVLGNINAAGNVTATSFTGTFNGTTGVFAANTGGQVLGVTQGGSGPGLAVENSASTSGSVAVLGNASNAGGTTVGVWGQNASSSGVALRGDSSSTTGSTLGVYGTNASTSGIGVKGNATATTGTTYGAVGSSASTGGTGVQGEATATTGSTIGVRGLNLSSTGIGVSGEASSSSGATVGLKGVVNSASGTAAVLINNGGGDILLGKQGTNQVFLVDKDGNVTASGSVTANTFNGLTSLSTTSLISDTATFSGSNGSQIAAVSQSGPGVGLSAVTTSTSNGASAINATASGSSGDTTAIWALNSSTSGIAVRGDSTATTGSTLGLYGTSSSTSGTAVRGDASATSGFTVGLHATNASTDGMAVEGDATASTGSTVAVYGSNASTSGVAIKGTSSATTGNTVGVYGTDASDAGIGLRGDVTSSTGFTVGVYGKADSSSGTGVLGTSSGSSGIGIKGTVSNAGAIAAVFDNSAGGNILVGSVNGTNKFRVNGSGDVYANTYNIGGADFAESVDVLGKSADYEPGDVVVIDTTGHRRVVLSSQPYSMGVAGIYSTKPGVLASPHPMDDPRLAAEIPLALVGIVPCKVSAENGPIQPGDLLVTSSTRGYVMKGTDRARMLGAIVGKALQPLESGTGVIEVLVTLQ